MKTITKKYKTKYFSSVITDRYLAGIRMGVFDIETLGLSPQFAPVILAGFMTIDTDGTCCFTQYFAETPGDEKHILENLSRDFETVDCLLTYNGKHFDIPFIQKRAAKQEVQSPDCNIYNLDLYLAINGYSEIRHILKHLRQKDIEIYMGLSDGRRDEISGAESVELYKAYLSCTDKSEKADIEQRILLHNHDDILLLYRILPVLKQLDIHRAFNALGFAVKGENGWPTFNVVSIKMNISGMSVSGNYRGETFSYVSYDTFSDNFSCEFRDDKTFEFKIRTDRHKGNTFVNLKKYFSEYEDLKLYPHYSKNFLLIGGSQSTNYLETNMFIKKFLNKFMNTHVCPRTIL
ncbi:MAG: ribonuclease H-like domain-containing protein [Anaerovoracaceae bacterium]|nr:ribonuclease H-like domain-containing protein [Bacillota bacterium]MEE0517208.1 ribonuclease H-like domain-containing protein [Anaerovoracaceae bacterium]